LQTIYLCIGFNFLQTEIQFDEVLEMTKMTPVDPILVTF